LKLDYEKSTITKLPSFCNLAEGKRILLPIKNLKNKPFFDGFKFHRVIKALMIQTGDPLGTGSEIQDKSKDELI
jgi:peptidylprolyl isomerase